MKKKEQERIFNDWMEKFKPVIFKIVRVYAKKSNNEDDLFQEIILQIWKSIRNFKRQSSTHTWIYRVALNTALKWSIKIEKNKHEVISEEGQVLSKGNEIDPMLEWLYDEISLLDPIDQSLTLLLLDGFSYKEMAEIIGITASNVGVKINRIKKKLKERAQIVER